MIGSTFIYAPDPSGLSSVAADLDALDEFDHVYMSVLSTLDFVLLCQPAGVEWEVGEPIAFSEQDGLAIVQVNPAALLHVIRCKCELDSHQLADIENLSAFIEKNGTEKVFELATF